MLWRFCSLWAAEAADQIIYHYITDRQLTKKKMYMKNDLAEENAGYKSVEIFFSNKKKGEYKNDNSKHK